MEFILNGICWNLTGRACAGCSLFKFVGYGRWPSTAADLHSKEINFLLRCVIFASIVVLPQRRKPAINQSIFLISFNFAKLFNNLLTYSINSSFYSLFSRSFHGFIGGVPFSLSFLIQFVIHSSLSSSLYSLIVDLFFNSFHFLWFSSIN